MDRPGLEPVSSDIELIRGVIVKGRVIDKETGKGVSAQVRMAPLPDNPTAAKMTDVSSYIAPVFTDAEGRYSLVTVPGPNVVVAESTGDTSKIEGYALNPYKTAELDDADRKKFKIDVKSDQAQKSIVLAGGLVETLEHRNAVKAVDLSRSSALLPAI